MKRERNGEGKRAHEKCREKGKRNTEASEHVVIESKEYKENRRLFEIDTIRRMGNRHREEIKQNEDKGVTKILGLGDNCHKIINITKEHNTMWKQRKLINKGQKKKNTETAENMKTENKDDHNNHKNT